MPTDTLPPSINPLENLRALIIPGLIIGLTLVAKIPWLGFGLW